jgi:hypothetical protein
MRPTIVTSRQRTCDRYQPSFRTYREANVPLQVTVCCGNAANVRLDNAHAAQSLRLVFLQEPRKLRLRGQTHLAHLVEEEHPAGGYFNLTG